MKRIIGISLILLSTLWAVDYDTEIQPIFNANCISCHGNNGGLSLAAGSSYDNLVDVVSQGYAPALRVVSGDPSTSVLYNKITNTGTYGQQMPPSSALSPTDIATIETWITELGAATVVDIATAHGMAEGSIVAIAGIITTPNFGTAGSSSQYYLQDATAGIVFYMGGVDAGLNPGDDVTITGELSYYNGVLEIVPSNPADIVVNSTGNELPAPVSLTLAGLLADAETYEAMLIQVDSVSITDGTWPDPGSNANLTVTDPSGATLTMRVDKDTDVDESEQPLGVFLLTAVVSQYDGTPPYDEGYQVFPRFATDIEVIGDPTPSITNVSQEPASPTPLDDVTISATIVDNVSVVSAALNYVVNSGVEMVLAMTNVGDEYSAVIPAQAANAVVEYYLTATDDIGGVTTGATYSYIVYSGDVTPIASIQDGTIPTGTSVTVQGIVTGEPYAFRPADDLLYYYLQDAESPYSGVKVYDPARELAEGDEIRITGTTDEYYDMTEIVDITDFELLSTGNVMNAMVVTLDEDLEMYEGCLIQVQNVTVSNPDLGYGEYELTDGTNTLVADDDADYFYYPQQDEALAAVTGVLDYSFGAYKLQPRLARDVVFANGITRIQAFQQVNYSDLLPHYTADDQVYFQDTSYMRLDTVTVEGIVTMPTGLSYAGAGVKFIFQDLNGGPWSSVLSYDPDSAAFPILYEGDVIRVTGYLDEYTTAASAMTELWITEEIEILDIGQAVPEEPVVTTGELRWPTTAEQWGTVMVKVEEATVEEVNPTPYDLMYINDGTGRILVDDDSDSLSSYIIPPPGSLFDSVRGWVYDHYGSYEDSSTYHLEPLYSWDLVLNTTSVDEGFVPDGYSLGNYPNPFNPSTTIRFRLPAYQDVRLVIYNERGQLVRNLVNETLAAGEYDVVWQGLDQRGRPVSSGIYFYRLLAGDQELVGKMTYLK